MNNFVLHEMAQHMADTESAYRISRRYLELENLVASKVVGRLQEEWVTLFESHKNPITGKVEDEEVKQEMAEISELIEQINDVVGE